MIADQPVGNFIKWNMLKKIGIGLLGIIVALILAGVIFINVAPQFGASPSGTYLEVIQKSPNYQEDHFENLIETTMDLGLSGLIATMKQYSNTENLEPSSPVPTFFDEPNKLNFEDSTFRITWYGHSAVLIETNGLKVFMDPMLGAYASPLPIFGKRFNYQPPIDLDNLEAIDAVIFSHDHYDHLDYSTILAIHEKVSHFFVPLGVGSHLRSWGVSEQKITELDWWQSAKFKSLDLVATPARHFSGRSIGDNNKTLWASWVIKTPSQKLYFSGDGGYGPHFAEIGKKYGPFDFAMMECGQYNERWSMIHMMPEETVKASEDLKAVNMMPIHWGAFTLAPHEWIEPAERVQKAASKSIVNLYTPRVGESFVFTKDYPIDFWWRSLSPDNRGNNY